MKLRFSMPNESELDLSKPKGMLLRSLKPPGHPATFLLLAGKRSVGQRTRTKAVFASDLAPPRMASQEQKDGSFCIPTDGIRCPNCSWSGGEACMHAICFPVCWPVACNPEICGSGTCYDGECEGLHEERGVRQQQAAWPRPGRAKLIIAAGTANQLLDTCKRVALSFLDGIKTWKHGAVGPERSGSTWLFNAIRILFQEAQQPLDPFWVTLLSQDALAARGAGCACSAPTQHGSVMVLP